MNYFVQHGLINPYRIRNLIKETIRAYKLELTDFVVFTEAASKYFVVTPIIAAMAGAKVYAIARDSRFGKVKDIEEFTCRFTEFCGVKDKIEIIFEKEKEIINQADIITNLGFVRPINKNFIKMMKKNAVIPLMYETWEFRETDLDFKFCYNQNIPVLGTNESCPPFQIFDYCGILAVKICLEAGLEVKNNKIAIYSSNKFGPVIQKALEHNSAIVHLFENEDNVDLDFIMNADGLFIAQMENPGNIFLKPSIKTALKKNQSIILIQYIGIGNLHNVNEIGIQYYPPQIIKKHRMAYTLSHLGPAPLIYLNAGGLKVGEIMAKLRQDGYSSEVTIRKALKNSICQDFSDEQKKRLLK